MDFCVSEKALNSAFLSLSCLWLENEVLYANCCLPSRRPEPCNGGADIFLTSRRNNYVLQLPGNGESGPGAGAVRPGWQGGGGGLLW